MKTVNNIQELIEKVDRENYYYKGRGYENYRELKEDAENFFKDNTADYEDREDYYKTFGLKLDEVHIDCVKTERYYNEETELTISVSFYRGYIDSGVPTDSYWHGYLIWE